MTQLADHPPTVQRSVGPRPVGRSSTRFAVLRDGELVPALVLGGEANALSVVRNLGRMGVKVYAVGESDSPVKASRYCRWVDVRAEPNAEEAWTRFLLGPESNSLRGAVVLACSDAGIRVLARNRNALLERYRLDLSDTAAQLSVLDKLTTYQHARAAGVPAPGFWPAATREQVLGLKETATFPVLLKPRLSHVFEARFGRKHVIAQTFNELLAAYDAAAEAGVDVLVMEYVPGPDDRLCSYFTFLDESGEPLFHFTKRVIRRYPAGMGAACYHVTDRIPEIIEPSLRLFRQAGLRGLANVEYKRDDRDGTYKLIEINARFVASNCLVSAAGLNLAKFVYSRIVGLPLPDVSDYHTGLRLWDPARDYKAFRERRRAGELTLGQWLRGLCHRQTFPFFAWRDPLPAAARLLRPLRRRT